jgi:hypothetical protein
LSMVATETALSPELTAIHYSAIEKVVHIIKLLDISR